MRQSHHATPRLYYRGSLGRLARLIFGGLSILARQLELSPLSDMTA